MDGKIILVDFVHFTIDALVVNTGREALLKRFPGVLLIVRQVASHVAIAHREIPYILFGLSYNNFMSRILITGGSGFVGSALVRRLVSQGHEVLITGRAKEQTINTPCLSYTFHDLDWNTISPIDIVYHQAAITNTTHKPDKDFYFVNVQCAKTLFYDALRHGCKKIVYASSCAVYGKSDKPFREEDANSSTPINAYGSSKILFDEWAIPWGQENGILVVGLHYSNIYGVGEEHKGHSSSMIYQLMQQMRSGPPRLFKWGEQKRDFVHIDDVVGANLLAACSKECGVFNVGSGNPTSFNRIVEVLNKIMGTNYTPDYIDNPIAAHYQNFTQCDLTKSTAVLGYRPKVELEEGVAGYVKNASGCSSSSA